jgi:hypothetical protein
VTTGLCNQSTRGMATRGSKPAAPTFLTLIAPPVEVVAVLLVAKEEVVADPAVEATASTNSADPVAVPVARTEESKVVA